MEIGVGPFNLFIFIEIGSNCVDQDDFKFTEVCFLCFPSTGI